MRNKILKNKQYGLSLLELMVSLSIGIILLLALVSVYMTAANTSKSRSTDDQLDESARQVYDRLQADLDLAGYVDIFDQMDGGTELVAKNVAKPSLERVQKMYGRLMPPGTSRPLTPIEIATSGAEKPISGTDTTLTVAYQVTPSSSSGSDVSLPAFSDSKSADSGLLLDCLGGELKAADERWVKNTYSFADNAFKCAGNKSTQPQPIVDNIEEMTFRYLITQPITSMDIKNMYDSFSGLYVSNIVSANDVNSSSLQWSGVTGVEVCMVVAGEPLNGRLASVAGLQEKVPTCVRNAAKDGYADDIKRPAGDKRLYRRYVKVLTIPNTLYFRQ